ncbi:MAG: SelT/SelW/SelH family (seleno)protein [Candidatus Rokuibacteriota bacterium]
MRLREEIRRSLGTAAKIRWGGFGELTVTVDGRTVFSRRAAGRVPEPGEVARLLASAR